MKTARVMTFAVLAIGAAASAASVAVRRGGGTLPTAVVTRGTFDDYLTLRGDIRPVRSIVLTAPASGGSDLQIIDLVRGGTAVARGERAAAAADVTISRQKGEKARYDVADSERIVANLTMRAPAEGTVSLLPNTRAGAAFSRSAPEFKRGDRAWFGAAIAELPDLRTVQMNCRLDEVDRAQVQAGSGPTGHADAISERDFHGTIREISAMAKPDFTTWPPVRNFDVVITLSDTDTRLRPGMNGSARLAVDRLRDVLIVPASAVFQSGAASVVYVAARSGFERRPVTIVRRNREQAVVTGVREGDRIALREPDTEER